MGRVASRTGAAAAPGRVAAAATGVRVLPGAGPVPVLPALLCALAFTAAPLSGQVFMTQDEALELAFPGAERVERRTAYLTDEDLRRASELAGEGAEVEVAVLPYYVALAQDGRPVGVAYFDAHRVRTLPEVLMVVVDVEDRVRRVEVVRFSEPPEYRAPGGWMDQFGDRPLDGELSLKGDIANITGATLTARAVTAAVRRVLALHEVIDPFTRGGAEEGRGGGSRR